MRRSWLRFAAASAALAAIAGCVSIDGIPSDLHSAGQRLCECVSDVYGGSSTLCAATLDARLEHATPTAREKWLATFASEHCDTSCDRAEKCLQTAPTCVDDAASCSADAECCNQQPMGNECRAHVCNPP